MPSWKFTDAYGTTYPALGNSILSVLVFEVPLSSPVIGTTFAGSLDIQATNQALGAPMAFLGALVGMTATIPMTGTVTTDQGLLKVSLTSTANDALLNAVRQFPLIGGKLMTAASLGITNQTKASASKDDSPDVDEFDLNTTVTIGKGSGNIVTRVPMSAGLFSMAATFENFGIGLADLDFLVPGGGMTAMFPGNGQLPASYYNPASTQLSLLSLQLTLAVQLKPAFSLSIATVSVSIGITNIPLYPNALYLNPLAVWISVTDPIGKPTSTWGLSGSIALYPAGRQTSPPSAPPDFLYDLAAEMPTSGNPQFSVTGTFENPLNLPVSQILKDLANDTTFDTGISSQLTLEQFDFAAAADTKSGQISEFSVEVAMDASKAGGTYVGLFGTTFGIKSFSIALAYSQGDGGDQ